MYEGAVSHMTLQPFPSGFPYNEKFSRQDRDRDCAKFESYRRFRDSNMNPKKK